MTPVTLADLVHSMTGLRSAFKILWDEIHDIWIEIEAIQKRFDD